MSSKVSVIGSGSWGTALSIVLATNGYNVHMYSRSQSQVEQIRSTGINSNYLPDIVLHENINVTNDLSFCVANSHLVILAIPSQQVRSILEQIKPFISEEQILVNVAKGIEKNTKLRLSEVACQVLPDNPYVLLSGPSHAEEVAKGIPTIVIATSNDMFFADRVREIFTNSSFHIYLNPDMVGVEISGALKNIIAFGAGLVDGAGFGDNTKAALITRGLYEITKLGMEMGAKYSTFNGLGGIGDLIVTCTSQHSRNWQAGFCMGQGKCLEQTLDEVKMVVEGITITEVAYEIAKSLNIKMPIVEAIYHIIKGEVSTREAVFDLIARAKSQEFEGIDLF